MAICLARHCAALAESKTWRFDFAVGIFYGFGRFLVEFQRPDAWMISGIATAQLIGIALVVLCGVLAECNRHTDRARRKSAQNARNSADNQERNSRNSLGQEFNSCPIFLLYKAG